MLFVIDLVRDPNTRGNGMFGFGKVVREFGKLFFGRLNHRKVCASQKDSGHGVKRSEQMSLGLMMARECLNVGSDLQVLTSLFELYSLLSQGRL